jgi:hypothetical protein
MFVMPLSAPRRRATWRLDRLRLTYTTIVVFAICAFQVISLAFINPNIVALCALRIGLFAQGVSLSARNVLHK